MESPTLENEFLIKKLITNQPTPKTDLVLEGLRSSIPHVITPMPLAIDGFFSWLLKQTWTIWRKFEISSQSGSSDEATCMDCGIQKLTEESESLVSSLLICYHIQIASVIEFYCDYYTYSSIVCSHV